MQNITCRVCEQLFFIEPVLMYENMPKSAQFLPNKNEIDTGNDNGINLDVYQCSGCGLIQLNVTPVIYYKEVIRAAGVSDEMTAFRQDQFKHWVENHALQGKKILEVGCGAGEYLSIMQSNDVKLFGIEQGTDSVSKCQLQGLNVVEGFIEQKNEQLKNGPFDAFYMLNYLEHLPDPNSTLKGICNNLLEGAVGLIEVPNLDMILRDNLISEFMSDHLSYFTKDTLISTLVRNNFEVIECSEVWHEYSLSAVVRKQSRVKLPEFHSAKQQLINNLHQLLSHFTENTIAIWGAGHQALAVMAMAGLGGKIKYVVDSAVFKQNKYTPATHIPIVSPDRLHDDPVDAIIIMAASYSNEVSDIIRRSYHREMKIFVLEANKLKELKSQ